MTWTTAPKRQWHWITLYWQIITDCDANVLNCFILSFLTFLCRAFQNTIVHLPSPYHPVTARQFPLYVFWPPVRTSPGWSGIPQPECFHRKRHIKSLNDQTWTINAHSAPITEKTVACTGVLWVCRGLTLTCPVDPQAQGWWAVHIQHWGYLSWWSGHCSSGQICCGRCAPHC